MSSPEYSGPEFPPQLVLYKLGEHVEPGLKELAAKEMGGVNALQTLVKEMPRRNPLIYGNIRAIACSLQSKDRTEAFKAGGDLAMVASWLNFQGSIPIANEDVFHVYDLWLPEHTPPDPAITGEPLRLGRQELDRDHRLHHLVNQNKHQIREPSDRYYYEAGAGYTQRLLAIAHGYYQQQITQTTLTNLQAEHGKDLEGTLTDDDIRKLLGESDS